MEVGGAGNHLVSLGAAYTHGKSCQQLIKEVGGGEILRGKNLEARVPTQLTILSPPGLRHRLGPVADTRALKGDPEQGCRDHYRLLQQ